MRRESGVYLIWSMIWLTWSTGAVGWGRPTSPLVAIYRPQIATWVGPFVPDAHPVFAEIFDVGIALKKPEQFVNDGFEMDFLGGNQGESLRQIEAHLVAKDADRAGAGPVVFFGAGCQHVAHQVEILFHRITSYDPQPRSQTGVWERDWGHLVRVKPRFIRGILYPRNIIFNYGFSVIQPTTIELTRCAYVRIFY